MNEALGSQQNSLLNYGSEFKPVELLNLIFSNHPLWSRLESHPTSGCNYPLNDLTKEKEKQDLLEALEFRNHKGVKENPDLFKKKMDEEKKNKNK